MAINSVFKERNKKIHLVGIGGIGMSGIARVLIESGFVVTGSDLVESSEIKKLRDLSAKIFIGHREENLGDADLVVYSSAVSPDNPELVRASAIPIPIIKRATMLAELMRLRCGIAVSGAHGKTTTTSLIGSIMHSMGLDPTVIIGGIVNQFASNAVVGKSQFMVTEADESDGTFLHLAPTIAVVTNIDAEHLDYYRGGIDDIKNKFREFLDALPFYGLGVLCADDAHVMDLLPSLNRRIVTYGLSDTANYRAQNIVSTGLSTSFDLYVHGEDKGRFTINLVGHYNVQNTLAAIAVLDEVGVPPSSLIEVLSMFNGVKRRFTKISSADNFCVIDDYAHHPTEIKAVLRAARASFAGKKIRVLFQPHRFSRVRDLLDDFSKSFDDCDSLVVTEIYGALEQPIDGINAQTLIDRIQSHAHHKVHYALDLDNGVKHIVDLTEQHDVVLTLGAGSITTAAPKIADLLLEKHGSVSCNA